MMKILSGLLLVCMACAPVLAQDTPEVVPTPAPLIKGDINDSGVFDLVDVISLSMGLTGEGTLPDVGTRGFQQGDIDGDGQLTPMDAHIMLDGLIVFEIQGEP
jgi:hypothetical protein